MKMRDDVDPYFWIKQTASALDHLYKDKKNVVVTDVRMLIEQDYPRKNFNNFFLVEVRRDFVTEGKEARTQVDIAHMTIDYRLNNNGSIKNLRDNVEKMLKDLNFFKIKHD